MDTVRINNPVQEHFAMVPNVLWQLPISCTAKAIFAYLLSFRDQSTVRVALIEKTLKIGREKRQNAMRELEEHKLIDRQIERHNGRIVTRALVVTTEPLLRRVLDEMQGDSGVKRLPPENPSLGEVSHLEPEKPAVGKPGPVVSETRSNRVGKPVPLYNTNINKRARKRCAATPAALPLAMADLSPFQRLRLLSGQSVLIDGQIVAAGSPQMEALRNLLRCDGLEEKAVS